MSTIWLTTTYTYYDDVGNNTGELESIVYSEPREGDHQFGRDAESVLSRDHA